MRIACLQFAPELGKVKENIAGADHLLRASPPQNLDILVLPELAFTGFPHQFIQYPHPLLIPPRRLQLPLPPSYNPPP